MTYYGPTSCPVIGEGFVHNNTLRDTVPTQWRAYLEKDENGINQAWVRLPPAAGKKVTSFKTDASISVTGSNGEMIIANEAKLYFADSSGIKQEVCSPAYYVFFEGTWYLTTGKFAYKYDFSPPSGTIRPRISTPKKSMWMRVVDLLGRRTPQLK